MTSLWSGQLGDLFDPLCDVDVVRVDATHPGVGEQRGEVGPLVGVFPQADVDKVLHLRREHPGWQSEESFLIIVILTRSSPTLAAAGSQCTPAAQR